MAKPKPLKPGEGKKYRILVDVRLSYYVDARKPEDAEHLMRIALHDLLENEECDFVWVKSEQDYIEEVT